MKKRSIELESKKIYMENGSLLAKKFQIISAEALIWFVTHASSVNRYCVTTQITNSDWDDFLNLIFESTNKFSLRSPCISNCARWETLISDHDQLPLIFRGFSKVFRSLATCIYRQVKLFEFLYEKNFPLGGQTKRA